MKPKQYKDDRGPDWEGLPMFTEARAKRNDPQTSYDAAGYVEKELPNLERHVFEAIRRSGERGMTGDELARETGIFRHTCCPRLAPLKRKGFIVDSGERRKGDTNHKQIVWRAR